MVYRILKLPKSNYYYHKSRLGAEKRVIEGRKIPGYSLQQDCTKVADEQIQEWLTTLILGEEPAYGYA